MTVAARPVRATVIKEDFILSLEAFAQCSPPGAIQLRHQIAGILSYNEGNVFRGRNNT
jgi:hypothetical protein